MTRDPALPLPEVKTSGTGACSANAVLFPRWTESQCLAVRDAFRSIFEPTQPQEDTDGNG